MTLLRTILALGILGLATCAPPPPLIIPVGQTILSSACVAGFYQCQLAEAGPIGSPCACPGLGAPSYGVIR